MNIVEFAEKIAMEAHKGQFRKDGITPYINHPIKVKEISTRIYKENSIIGDLFLTDLQIIALAHDLAEDTLIDVDKFIRELYNQFPKYNYSFIRTALNLLNKNNFKNYLEYIKSVKTMNLAAIVKLADLEHNMSDLKSGSLKDKYLLAQYILLN